MIPQSAEIEDSFASSHDPELTCLPAPEMLPVTKSPQQYDTINKHENIN